MVVPGRRLLFAEERKSAMKLNKKKTQEATSFGIIGLGRFGMALAMTLANSGKEVIVVDRSESKVKEIRPYTDYAFVVDDLNMETLKEIGIQNCDVVVVCIGEKMDISILTTMRVIEMGVPHVISKAISTEQGTVLKRIGAEVVYPEKDMAFRLGKRLVSNNFLDYISLDNSIEIRQIKIADSLVGQSIEEIEIRQKYGLNIIAIENENVTTIEVTPDYRFKKDDIIVVIGKINNMDEFEKDM